MVGVREGMRVRVGTRVSVGVRVPVGLGPGVMVSGTKGVTVSVGVGSRVAVSVMVGVRVSGRGVKVSEGVALGGITRARVGTSVG